MTEERWLAAAGLAGIAAMLVANAFCDGLTVEHDLRGQFVQKEGGTVADIIERADRSMQRIDQITQDLRDISKDAKPILDKLSITHPIVTYLPDYGLRVR